VCHLPPTGTVELTWPSFTNVTYAVESSTNLVTWQDQSGSRAGVSGVMTQAVTSGKACEFFRVRLQE